MVNISSENIELVNQIYAYISSGDLASAQSLINANPELKDSIFDAEKYNRLVDAVKALQRLYMNDIQTYLMEAFQDRGEWSDSMKYNKFDVTWTESGNTRLYYVCKSNDTPIGTLPSNTTYFYQTTLQGIQGVSGTGLAPRGVWNSSVTYYVNDCVSYNNILWQCLVQNTNSIPSGSNQNWLQIMAITKQIAISQSEPSDQAIDDIWLQVDDELNFTPYRKTATGYDALVIKTDASQVTYNGDSTVEAMLNDLDANKSNLTHTHTELSSLRITEPIAVGTPRVANVIYGTGNAPTITADMPQGTLYIKYIP